MAGTPSRRLFLGWDPEKSALRCAADLLVDREAQGGVLDLGGVIVAFPGRRAGRRFLEVLVQTAEGRGLRLCPPQITTAGALPEVLLATGAGPPAAGRSVRRWAWIQAYQALKAKDRDFLLPTGLSTLGPAAWIRLADEADRLCREVAAGKLGFEEVARTKGLPDSAKARWKALAALHAEYRGVLEEVGAVDPRDRLITAIRKGPAAFRRDRTAFLVGAVDLTPLQKAAMACAADRVEVLVPAPEDLAKRFDEWGCVNPGQWEKCEIPLRDEQVHLVGGPEDVVEQVLYLLHDFAGSEFTADQVTVGVNERALYPALERRLEEAGVAAHPAPGIPLSNTPPVKLLRAVEAFLEDRSFSAAATLLRHEDFAAALDAGGEGASSAVLSELDRYHAEHLPYAVELLSSGKGRSAAEALLAEALDVLRPLEAELRTPGEWAGPILGLLRRVYGSLDVGPSGSGDPAGRIRVEACLAACRVLSEYVEGERAAVAPLRVRAAEAIRLLLRDLEQAEGIPRDPDPGAVELLGWLELPLDDAPALVVTGLNEGFVPEPHPLHPDLPDSLRAALDLPSNATRFARDAFFLESLCRTRKALHVVAARRSVEGDSLAPSRLLFARRDGKARATLVRRLHEAGETPLKFAVHVPPAPAERTGFIRPEPVCRYARKVISVTAFATYLRSPYLFYLQEVLGLEGVDDTARELDPLAFGSLAHGVLAEFGRSGAKDSEDEEAIREVLEGLLDARVTACFGADPQPAVRIQKEQLRERLRAFAAWQAEWRKEGWRIQYVERGFREKDRVPCPGRLPRPLYLVGRIDRIDRNEKTGAWALFDYKTGEQAWTPKYARRSDGEWRDLQLPLYRYLFRRLKPEAEAVRLGYICLPNDPNAVGEYPAEWGPEDLAGAVRKAAETAEAIHGGVFPMTEGAEPWDPVLRDLCGLGMLRPEGEGGEE